MKNFVLFLLLTFTHGMAASQNPCDAELSDTLSQIKNNSTFLGSYEIKTQNSDYANLEKKMILRKNTRYRFTIGNSSGSDSKAEMYISNEDSIVKELTVETGELKSFNYTVKKTGEFKVNAYFDDKGNNCVYLAIYFLKKTN